MVSISDSVVSPVLLHVAVRHRLRRLETSESRLSAFPVFDLPMRGIAGPVTRIDIRSREHLDRSCLDTVFLAKLFDRHCVFHSVFPFVCVFG